MVRRWIGAGLAGTLLTAVPACQQQTESQQASSGKAKTETETAAGDAEMQAKMAQAKAAFDKLSPAEKKKLAAEIDKATNTLPLPLADAGTLKVQRQGQPASLLSSMAAPGTPTIIAAWASWCVPCKVEARELAQLRSRYKASQLNIVYLNIGDPKVEASKGPEFLRQSGAEALGLTMIAPKDFSKLTRVEQLSVPRVLVYDRTGKPTQVIAGSVTNGPDPRLIRAITRVAGS